MNLEVEEKKHGVSKKPYLFHEDCLVDLINGLVTLNKKKLPHFTMFGGDEHI